MNKIYFIAIFMVFNCLIGWTQSLYFKNINSEHIKKYNDVSHYHSFAIDKDQFRNFLLQNVPSEKSNKSISISLPMPDGNFREFNVSESAVMEEGLAVKFPEIKTYKGYNSDYYIRFSISPYSFQIYYKAYNGDDAVLESADKLNNIYRIYHASDIIPSNESIALSCGTSATSKIIYDDHSDHKAKPRAGGAPNVLRKFRLALSCTGEWGSNSNLGGGTTATALDKMVSSVSLLNSIYEIDFGSHLDLIANTDKIIFLSAVSDPYINATTGGAVIPFNTDIINGRIGINSYDIGHVFTIACTDVGGVAFLASLCNRGNKAGAITCWYTTDQQYVVQRIFCHEMGHQFSAAHTFSNCNGNESGATAFEPGSGSTIMSYNSLCGGALNVIYPAGSPRNPNFFHSGSIEQAYNLTRNALTCGTNMDNGNTSPVAQVLVPDNLYLPISTPFYLKGAATDMEDQNTLSYGWEQMDAGSYGPALGQPSLTAEGPLFVVLFPSKNTNRVLPNWNAILNNKNREITEMLPSVSRNVNWRFIVRDNHPNGGAVGWADYKFKATSLAGPFTVNFPNQSTDILYKNSCNIIKWDVANTDKAPVNCQKVRIVLFKNGDVNNPIILKSNIDNDGSEIVEIPDMADDNNARIAVYAEDNIFFDVSDEKIRITSNPPNATALFDISPKKAKICLPNKLELKAKSCAFGNFNGKLNLIIEKGVPQGSTVSFSKSTIDATDQASLSIDMNNLNSRGNYEITVGAITPNGDTIRQVVEVEVIKNEFNDQALLSPHDGAYGLSETPVLRWKKSINADLYDIEIATSPAYGNSIIYRGASLFEDSLKVPIFLKPNTIFYWRAIPKNSCQVGNATVTYVFQTINKKCVNAPYKGNPAYIDPNKTKNFDVLIDESGQISDINLNGLEMDAFDVRDIKIQLQSPSGSQITLFEYQCAATSLFDCSFDDESPTAIICPPNAKNTFIPKESLKKFNGENVKGLWKLNVTGGPSLSDAYLKNFTVQYCADVTVQSPSLIKNLPLIIANGATKAIGNDLLACTDPDSRVDSIVYTIVGPVTKGDLLLNGSPLTYGSTFTQRDIDDNRLAYKHTGSSNSTDGFTFTVNDLTGGFVGTQFFTILIGSVNNQDIQKLWNVKISPNPAYDKININLDKTLSKNAIITISDMTGIKIFSDKFGIEKNKTITISQLLNGIYLLTIKDGNVSQQIKFVKID